MLHPFITPLFPILENPIGDTEILQKTLRLVGKLIAKDRGQVVLSLVVSTPRG